MHQATKNRSIVATAICFATLSVGGCASVAVTGDAIEKNTAMTLGLEKGEFTISDRVDDGMKTTYIAKTNSGKKYNCYVEGTVSLFGRVVSDAICREVGKPAGTSSSGTKNPECNDLLKAAGKC